MYMLIHTNLQLNTYNKKTKLNLSKNVQNNRSKYAEGMGSESGRGAREGGSGREGGRGGGGGGEVRAPYRRHLVPVRRRAQLLVHRPVRRAAPQLASLATRPRPRPHAERGHRHPERGYHPERWRWRWRHHTVRRRWWLRQRQRHSVRWGHRRRI